MIKFVDMNDFNCEMANCGLTNYGHFYVKNQTIIDASSHSKLSKNEVADRIKMAMDAAIMPKFLVDIPVAIKVTEEPDGRLSILIKAGSPNGNRVYWCDWSMSVEYSNNRTDFIPFKHSKKTLGPVSQTCHYDFAKQELEIGDLVIDDNLYLYEVTGFKPIKIEIKSKNTGDTYLVNPNLIRILKKANGQQASWEK